MSKKKAKKAKKNRKVPTPVNWGSIPLQPEKFIGKKAAKHFADARKDAETFRLTNREYLRHELLDRLDIVAEMVNIHLVGSMALLPGEAFDEPDRVGIMRQINTARDCLINAYQTVGEIHL